MGRSGREEVGKREVEGKREVGGGGRASRAASSSGSILSDKTDKHSTQSGLAGWQGNVYFTSQEVTSASIYMCWTLFTIEGQII